MTINDFVTTLSNIGSAIAYIVAIGSLLASVTPPPLDKEDPDNSRKGRLRKTKFYRIYYKTVSFCAANIGWAKNLASPRVVGILGDVIRGAVSHDALFNLANEAEQISNEAKEKGQVSPPAESLKAIATPPKPDEKQ